MAASATITFTAQANLTADPVGAGSSATLSLPFSYSQSLTDGTTAGKIDRIYHKRLTLSTTPTDIDLTGGITLTDAFGTVVTFAEICGIFVKNNSTTVGQNVQLGGDANGLIGWVASNTDIISIKPGGLFVVLDPTDPGYVVTGTTADILQIAAAAGTPTADIMILGRSA